MIMMKRSEENMFLICFLIKKMYSKLFFGGLSTKHKDIINTPKYSTIVDGLVHGIMCVYIYMCYNVVKTMP